MVAELFFYGDRPNESVPAALEIFYKASKANVGGANSCWSSVRSDKYLNIAYAVSKNVHSIKGNEQNR